MSKAAEVLSQVILNDPDWTLSLIEAIPDGILIVDGDGFVRYANAAYLRLAGLKREDAIGKDLSVLRPGAVLPQAVKTGETRVAVYRKIGNTEYIADVAPISHKGTIIGGISVSKLLHPFLLLSKELEEHVRKTKELRSVVNRAQQARYNFDDIIGNSLRFQEAISMGKKMASFKGDVVRHEMPNVGALNFVMYKALGGGVTRTLALDMHGKCLASAMGDMEIPDN